jgi:aerobic carbon-monoxide dehydrogenase large subunit
VKLRLRGCIEGYGEAGTIGAPPAVMNALLDALAPLGITDLQMPATPRRIWEAMQAPRLS